MRDHASATYACAPTDAREVGLFHLPSSTCVATRAFDADVLCAEVVDVGDEGEERARALVTTADGGLFGWEPSAAGDDGSCETMQPACDRAICAMAPVGAQLGSRYGAGARVLLVGTSGGEVLATDLRAVRALPTFEKLWAGDTARGAVLALEFIPPRTLVPAALAAAAGAELSSQPDEPGLLLVGHASGGLDVVALGPTLELSARVHTLEVGGPVRSALAQPVCAALGARERVAIWVAADDGGGGGAGRRRGAAGASVQLCELERGAGGGARVLPRYVAAELSLPADDVLDVRPAPCRAPHGARALALVLTRARGGAVLRVSALDVSALLRSADADARLTAAAPAELCALDADERLAAAASAPGSADAPRLHVRALSDSGAVLPLETAAPAGGAGWAAAVRAAVGAAGDGVTLPAAHPSHAPRPSVRAHVLGGGRALGVHVTSRAAAALDALSARAGRALQDDGTAEALWRECWRAGVLRGVCAGEGAGGRLAAADDLLLLDLEQVAQAQPARDAAEVWHALRAAAGGDKAAALALARLQLLEAGLRHSATAAAAAGAVAADGAASASALLGVNSRDLVREWAVGSARALAHGGARALRALADAVDGGGGGGGGGGGDGGGGGAGGVEAALEAAAGADACALALERLCARANALAAVLATLAAADGADVAAGRLAPAALEAVRAPLDELVCAAHACRWGAFLCAHALLVPAAARHAYRPRAAPPPLPFPLRLGRCFALAALAPRELGGAAAGGGAAAAAEGGGGAAGVFGTATGGGGVSIGGAAELLDLAGRAPAALGEAVYYALCAGALRAARAPAGGGADAAACGALWRACALLERGTAAHGAALPGARAHIVRALAHADAGCYLDAAAHLARLGAAGSGGARAGALVGAAAVGAALADACEGGGVAAAEGAEAARALSALLARAPAAAPAPRPQPDPRVVRVRLLCACAQPLHAYAAARACPDGSGFGALLAALHARGELCSVVQCPLTEEERAALEDFAAARPQSAAAHAARVGLHAQRGELAQARAAADALGAAALGEGGAELRGASRLLLELLGPEAAGAAAEPRAEAAAGAARGVDGRGAAPSARARAERGPPRSVPPASPAPAWGRASGTPYSRSRARESLLAALASPAAARGSALTRADGARASGAPPAPPAAHATPTRALLGAPPPAAGGADASRAGALGLPPSARPHAPAGSARADATAALGLPCASSPLCASATAAAAWPGAAGASPGLCGCMLGAGGTAPPALPPTRLATPQLPAALARCTPSGARADGGAEHAAPFSALTSATHLPTPKRSSLRLRGAVPPSPPTWTAPGARAAGSAPPGGGCGGQGLFHPTGGA